MTGVNRFLRAVRDLALFLVLASTLNAFEEPTARPEEPSKDLVVERTETTYHFQNDGTGETIRSVRLRALTGAGRDAIGQMYFPYSSQTDDLRIDYFRTVKPDSRVVAADPSKAFEVASPVAQIAPTFSDLKVKAMVAPDLNVGDALEYQTTDKLRAPLKPGDFWVIHFSNRNAMVQLEVVTFDVPAGRALTFKSQEGVRYQAEEKNGRKIYRWELSNLKPWKPEDPPQQPLFAASTFADWKQLGEWYLSLQRDSSEATPEIRALATKLTASKATAHERVDAIYTYVSESIRYVGISFGIGGYQAHPAAEVLRNGYGDCKDKEGLLAALLGTVGLKAYPVLVNSQRGVIEPAVPMPGQFDHVMSVVPLDGEAAWMDTTLEVAPMGVLMATVRGKQALLMEPGAIRLAEVPLRSPVEDENTLAANGKLDAAGKLTMDNRLDLRGQAEVLYRRIFRLGNKEAIDALIKVLGTGEVDGATTEAAGNTDPADLSQPFDLRYKVSKPDFFAPLDKSKETIVPHSLITSGPWNDVLHKAEEARKRQSTTSKDGAKSAEDIDLGARSRAAESIDLELDPVYQVDLPLPVHVDRQFGSYDSDYRFDHGHLRTNRTLVLKQEKLAAGHWQELDSFSKLVDRDLDQKVTVRRTGKVDLLSQADQMSADDLNSTASTLIDQKKDFSLARDLLLKATAKDPNHKWAWNNLGRAYLALGSAFEAEKAYKKQIEINPNDEYTYKNLGWLYAGTRRFDEAIAAYRKHIEINPLDKDVYGYLGRTLGWMGKWDEAAQAWAKSAALNHDKPDDYIAWGHALLKAGKTEDGRKQLDRAVELDSSATILNNAAWELADAGVDLDKAEREAKQAVEKESDTLSGPLSLDGQDDYVEKLRSLGADLDTLGWVYFQKGGLDDAGPYLLMADQLEMNSTVAEHIAQLRARQDKFEEALRYYAYAQMERGWTGQAAKELVDYLTKKAGGSDQLTLKVQQAKKTFGDQRKLQAAGAPFAWPANSTATKATFVQIAVVADSTGSVKDSRVLSGEEPFREAALGEVRRLRLPPIAWPGRALESIRTVDFLYKPPSMASSEKRVDVSWRLGKPPAGTVTMITPDGEHVATLPASLVPGVEKQDSTSGNQTGEAAQPPSPEYAAAMQQGLMLRQGRNLEGAISKFRQAIKMEPNCAACHRVLADTLAEKGDRAGSITEYMEVVGLEPDNPEVHYMLGVQFEASGAAQAYSGGGFHFDPKTNAIHPVNPTLPKSARADYESALEQYRLAHQLAPAEASYKETYERLQKQLRHP